MEMSDALAKQRAHIDRRGFSWQTVFFGFCRSRRHYLRREDDADAVFIDRHHPWLFFLAVGTMLLSCLDAFMTLQLLERGMIEANPFMAAILGQGVAAFTNVKLSMTAVGILALVFLANSRFMNSVRTGLFLTGIFSLYACLVCYEFVMLLRYL